MAYASREAALGRQASQQRVALIGRLGRQGRGSAERLRVVDNQLVVSQAVENPTKWLVYYL